MKKGHFIVFEGIDGAGKTTHIARLAKYLGDFGQSVIVTAEPTDGASGKTLRKALSGEIHATPSELASLFVLDRIAHNVKENGIKDLLAEGKTVICDRYYYSTMAYQGGETDFEWVARMNLDCPDITKPDLCIFLDLSPEESIRRIEERGEEKEIFETLVKLTSVREKFFRTFEYLKGGSKNIYGNKTITEDIDEAINGCIGGNIGENTNGGISDSTNGNGYKNANADIIKSIGGNGYKNFNENIVIIDASGSIAETETQIRHAVRKFI